MISHIFTYFHYHLLVTYQINVGFLLKRTKLWKIDHTNKLKKIINWNKCQKYRRIKQFDVVPIQSILFSLLNSWKYICCLVPNVSLMLLFQRCFLFSYSSQKLRLITKYSDVNIFASGDSIMFKWFTRQQTSHGQTLSTGIVCCNFPRQSHGIRVPTWHAHHTISIFSTFQS